MKSALIQTRVEPSLKAEVEKILREIGTSTSEAITIFLNRVRMCCVKSQVVFAPHRLISL